LQSEAALNQAVVQPVGALRRVYRIHPLDLVPIPVRSVPSVDTATVMDEQGEGSEAKIVL
ncbi:MAG: hypothetical protein ACM3XO_22395, partial [Bacteroidota bacterium]